MSETYSFAARLRELRGAAKMTQHELAERSGLHRQVIAKLELGDNQPTWITVQKLAAALGVDCAVFLDPSLQEPASVPTRQQGRPKKGEAEEKPAKRTRKKKAE
jgi:transcriptional regulator with XRE-family HTH domain